MLPGSASDSIELYRRETHNGGKVRSLTLIRNKIIYLKRFRETK